MEKKMNQPRDFDSVLGKRMVPTSGAVLGGLEAVRNRLSSPVARVRVAALTNAVNYGEEGLDLVIQALQDSTKQVQHKAAQLLRDRGGTRGRQVLLDCNPLLLFKTFENWRIKKFIPEVGIKEPIGTAFFLKNKEQLEVLVKDPQAKNVEALKCQVAGNNSTHRDFVDFLIQASDRLPNLKALFIGETNQYLLKKPQASTYNLLPLLDRYKKLEVLQIRGYLDEDSFKPTIQTVENGYRDRAGTSIKSQQHNSLRTLIIETREISDLHLARICNLNLPSLDFFELHFCQREIEGKMIKSLEPLLTGKSCPYVAYLGLRDSVNTDALALAVAKSTIIEHLKLLNFSTGTLSEAGVYALLDSRAVYNLHTLDLSKNRIPASMIKWLSDLSCRVITD